ncbi:MAG: hypothetical protein V7L20_05255 [Nostoc sp.]
MTNTSAYLGLLRLCSVQVATSAYFDYAQYKSLGKSRHNSLSTSD